MLSHALLVVLAIGAAHSSAGGGESTDCNMACEDGLPGTWFRTAEDMPQLAERVPLLFVGRVIKAETLCSDRYAHVTFRVKKVWKGDAQPAITILTGAGCARPFPFAIGQEYLVAARETRNSDTPYEVHTAFLPKEGSAAQPFIRALDNWQAAKLAATPAK